MKPPEDLAAQIAEKTNDELWEILRRPEDWLPEALDMARAELQRRGIEAGVEPPPIPTGQVLFFPVSLLKLVVMSTVTFGIYELYWFYKNWALIEQRAYRGIKPFWRAFFGVIFCYSCFREIKQVTTSHSLSFPASPALLAVVWIALTLAWRLPDPYWFVTWLTPAVLVPTQNVVNRLNGIVAPDHSPNARFSGWNIAAIVVGGIMWALTIIGTVLPE